MRLENEFDQLVKNILENSEEKAPSGAWRNIHSRLVGATPKASPRWWWLLAPAFCALTAVILLNRPSATIPSQATVAEAVTTGQIAEIVSAPAEEPQPVELLPTPERKVLAMATKPAEIAKVTEIVTTQVTKAEEPAETVEVQAPATAVEENIVPQEKAAETAIESDGKISWDEFNRQSKESTKGHKFCFDAKGVAIGNSNNFLSRSGRDQFGYGIGSGSSVIVETSESSYSIPFSVGIGGRIHLLPQLSIGTGISYSLVSRKFTGTYESSQEQQIQHNMHYLGIPVDVQFDFLQLHILNLFVNAGAQVDYCVANIYNIGGTKVTDAVSGVQASVNAGVGVEFKLSKHVGIFVAPGVKYYFNCNQPKSVRTERPFNFQLDGGLRFSL